ncbi:AzlC family ABC transporter permease [Roseibium salinum]|nr:AzlC family ABC transporter permease [Roseibium salinum]
MINSLVFAGASQFVAMEVYSDPLTWGALVAMVGVTGAVNMRMLLIGASLRPWLGRVPAHKTYPALFFLTDLNWLLALSEYNKGTRDWGGSISAAASSPGPSGRCRWCPAILPAASFPIRRPSAWMSSCRLFFAALLVPLWKGKRQTVSWLIAGGVATVTWMLVGGYWSIFTGAIAGAVAGAYLDD